MSKLLPPTPSLEALLNESGHPETDKAIAEFHKLLHITHHLTTAFIAVKHQTDYTAQQITELYVDTKRLE